MIIIFLTYKIIAPFLAAIAGAIILSVALRPLYCKLEKKVKYKNLAATIMVIIVVLIILIPLFFVASALIKEASTTYQLIDADSLSQISEKIENVIGLNLNLEERIQESISNWSNEMVNSLSKLFLSLANKVIEFFIMVFLMFYLFRDGDKIAKKLKETIPLEKKYRDAIAKEFKLVTHAVIYGFIVAGLAQGIVGGLGFFIFGVPNAIMWGIVMAILSILPIIGAWLVWIPATLYLIMSGQIMQGVFLFLYGMIIISNVDNVIKPFVIGARSKIHPALVLIGVFGGLKLMGLVGIVLGPLILAFLMVFFKLSNKKNVLKSKAT